MTRSARRIVVGALLGGLVLVNVPACTTAPASRHPAPATAREHPGPGSAGTGAATGRRAAVTALLDGRARAVRTGDRAAFLATVDPAADQRFRAAQRRQFDNLRAVPLGDWRYTLDPVHDTDTAHLPVAADELWAPAVQLRYALAGLDPTPVGQPMGYLFARRGTHWYLASDTALGDRGPRTWRGPWNFGPCVVLRTRLGLVLAHPDLLPVARRIGAELDAAVRTVDEVWQSPGTTRAPWTGRVAVLVPSSRAELRAQVGGNLDPDAVAAISTAAASDPRTHTATGQRVVFDPADVAALPAPALRILLRHEITHVAARGYTVDGLPQWVAEGFAEYVGYRDSGLAVATAAPELAEQVRGQGPPPGLPADAAFAGRGHALGLAYQQAWTMARYVRDRFSERTLVTLYRTVAARGPGTPVDLDADVRAATGISFADLVAGWRRYLDTTLR